jgi:hypothetical protein
VKRTLAKVVLGIGLVLGGAAVGHNVNVYHGADQWVGVIWGTVGGCEVGTLAHNYGWRQTGTAADYVACWHGIND